MLVAGVAMQPGAHASNLGEATHARVAVRASCPFGKPWVAPSRRKATDVRVWRQANVGAACCERRSASFGLASRRKDLSLAVARVTVADLPDFSTHAGKASAKAASEDAPRNTDPYNQSISVNVDSALSFRGHTLNLQGGSTRCARTFAQFLERAAGPGAATAQLFGGAAVLEAGSGTGLGGIVATLLGARSVDLTDQASVLELLENNVRSNLPSQLLTRVRVRELLWGPISEGSAYCGAAGSFDVLLCLDLVYAKEAMQPLVQTLASLTGPLTTVLQAYIHRFPWEVQFFDMMAQHFSRTLLMHEDGIWIYAFKLRTTQ
mmetsp:Transcript_60478/g.194731  ORF Transcript_60478/g.194731 Transcript_60478/m.194731 type:complete len:320 (+) Transcript_60478:228-1187(+)